MNTTLFTENHELEYKLNSKIDEKKFLSLKNKLDKKCWEKTDELMIYDEIYENNTRKSLINKNENIYITKTQLYNKIIQINNKHDLKCSVSLEKPLENIFTGNIKCIRSKHRFSYFSTNWKFDLSIINNENFEVELEFFNLHYMRNNFIHDLHSIAVNEFTKIL